MHRVEPVSQVVPLANESSSTPVGADSSASASPPAATPVVPVQWQAREADGAWCPPEVATVLPWAGRFPYADRVSREGRTANGWHVFGMSQRGRVHAHQGAHREDALALEWNDNGFALAAADGAGSASMSRVGAECVCRAVAREAISLFESAASDKSEDQRRAAIRQALVAAIESAVKSLHDVARVAGLTPRDFRTTALACVVSGDVVAAVQIGDGAIVAIDASGRVNRLGVADSGSYSGEVSAFVPELDGMDVGARVVFADLRDVHAILVVTDGIEDPFYPFERRGAEVAGQLQGGVTAPAAGFQTQVAHGPIVGEPDALERLAQWMSFERRGENDDRTIVAAFRLPAGFAG